MGVIFDLDQTIVDSQSALEARKTRVWNIVYELIPGFTLYDGIGELIADLNKRNIPIAIVTSSPRPYCIKVLDHHQINIVNRVCYHDTNLRKPNPDPILKAIELMGVSKDQVISVGDDPNDIIASQRAGVMSVAATWGSFDSKSLLSANPDAVAYNIHELKRIIHIKYNI